MNREVDVLQLRPQMKIRLHNGLVATVLKATTKHRNGTATVHTNHGGYVVALPCTAMLA